MDKVEEEKEVEGRPPGSLCWGACGSQTPHARLPLPPSSCGTVGIFGSQIGPELVSEALVVILVICAKNVAWQRELWSSSVS